MGPEEIEAVQALRPNWDKARWIGDMREDEWDMLIKMMNKSARQVKKAVKASKKRYCQAANNDNGQESEEEDETKLQPSVHRRPFEEPRPVVTYMWRGDGLK